MKILGTTAIYGIIGQPVAHSLSPLFQNRFLRQHHIDAAYLPLPVDHEASIPTVLAGLHSCGIAGFNVTVPYKEAVAKIVDCDDDARAIGAINTVRRTSDGWQACNTDYLGIQQVLTALIGTIEASEVVLFGAGGTARAVLHACNQMGVKKIGLCNRTASRAKMLAIHAQDEHYQTVVESIAWDQQAVNRVCKRAAVVINTTTIGLHNHDPFPFDILPCNGAKQGAAFDAVYRPNGITSFTTAASKQGRRAIDGLPLLIAQGVASFYYWHQLSIDRQLALDDMCQQLQRTPCVMNSWGNNQ